MTSWGGKTLDGRAICSPDCPIAARVIDGRPVANFDLHTRTKSGCKVCLNVSSLPAPTDQPGRFTMAHLFRSNSRHEKVRKLAEKLHAALREITAAAPCGKLDPPNNGDDPPSGMAPDLPLTRREREILCLLHAGGNTAGIARELFISPTTVRNHIQHLLKKLGAHSRLQALAIAFQTESGEASHD